jgi:hypothetical protein
MRAGGKTFLKTWSPPASHPKRRRAEKVTLKSRARLL